jgi:hypothetical protein
VQDHKFKIGQSVSLTSGPFGRGGTNGIYKVTQLLPLEGDDYQYRIKSVDEPHERVAKGMSRALLSLADDRYRSTGYAACRFSSSLFPVTCL